MLPRLRRFLTSAASARKPRPSSGGVTRRAFFASSAMTTAAALMPSSASSSTTKEGPVAGTDRASRAYAVRVEAAKLMRDDTRSQHATCGDETRYADRCASFSKGLPHGRNGEVDLPAYRAMVKAIESGHAEDLERIPLGGYVKLANPHASLAFELAGPDAQQLAIPKPPAFASEQYANELTELYWQSLVRDVPFASYDSHELVQRAAAEMKETPATLFRGETRGARVGPYVSQFLLRDIPLTPIRVPQKIRTNVPGKDYMTSTAEWLAIQNGGLAPVNTFDTQARHVRSGRDLAEYVHKDFTYQFFLSSALMLLKMSAPLDGGIPYQYSVNQGGFVTFGPGDILHFVASVANGALKSAWFQKWAVHRMTRPEEAAARVHFHLEGKGKYPLHARVLESEAVDRTRKQYGTALLPQAYPEGAPLHPAYPSGHAVIAGAGVTVLKAWFAETWVMPRPIVASMDGLSLVPWTGADLTVGAELDKLAENVAFGRNYAGIHWRCDAMQGLRLGEAFAIHYLREMKLTRPEFFHGFSLTKFDGERVTV